MRLHTVPVVIAICLVFATLLLKVESRRRGVVTVKLTGIKCNNTLSKTVVNTTCNLKSYSRTNTVLNFESYVIRYVNSSKAKLRLTIYYRVRTKYQQFLDHTVDDFCGILAGGKNAFMDRLFLDPVRLAAPDMFHPCPYYGYFGTKNFSLNIKETNDDSLLPRGDYKYIFLISDEVDPYLGGFTLTMTSNTDIEF